MWLAKGGGTHESILNCAGPIISQIKEPWFGIILSDDQLRMLLKRTFYPQSYFEKKRTCF